LNGLQEPIGQIDFEAIETAARQNAIKLAAQVLSKWINSDKTDYMGSTISCPSCNGVAHYAGRQKRTFLTAIGEMPLNRAYYHCANCSTGIYPRDQALGIVNSTVSPFLERIIGITASMVSFKESEVLLSNLSGLSVDAKQIERTSEKLGKEISVFERTVAEQEEPDATTMYLGMDGTGIPMRKSELAGRQGKQADGSSKTREVKLVTVWTATKKDKEGIPERDIGSVSYSAAIESAACRDTDELPSDFACRVEREAKRRGIDKAQRLIILGDGARWIWNIAEEHFPSAVQIVDLFHAKGTVSEVARVIFGPGSDIGKQWAKNRRDELEAGALDAVLSALAVHTESYKEAQTCTDYIIRNRERMNYPLFRSRGLCTSSGVVEAGCKLAIGTRLKRAGMHWTVAGADAIIALRCCRLSGKYEDFWEWRKAG